MSGPVCIITRSQSMQIIIVRAQLDPPAVSSSQLLHPLFRSLWPGHRRVKPSRHGQGRIPRNCCVTLAYVSHRHLAMVSNCYIVARHYIENVLASIVSVIYNWYHCLYGESLFRISLVQQRVSPLGSVHESGHYISTSGSRKNGIVANHARMNHRAGVVQLPGKPFY